MRLKNSFAIILTSAIIFGCTKKQDNGGSNSSSNIDRSVKVTIQKNEGINVNESDAIWITGLKPEANNKRVIKVHHMALNSELGYPVQTSDLVVTGGKAAQGWGVRTYVIEEGLLLSKAGDGEVGLYLARNEGGSIETIWESSSGIAMRGRATPLGYRISRNGQNHDYIAIAYLESNEQWYRFVRFKKVNGQFVRVRDARVNYVSSSAQFAGVYTGFLNPCGIRDSQGNCEPRFWGGRLNDFMGVNLARINISQESCVSNCSQALTLQHIDPPNKSFVSQTHPNGGNLGTINRNVYSMSGDEEGNHFLFRYPDAEDTANFTSYDKVNQLVFAAHRNTALEPDGSSGGNRAALYVFKKECFISDANCDPLALKPNEVKARIFRDVGEELGPTSDLGNGCVAVLSFRRPDADRNAGNVVFAKVYRACIRDPRDLDKGLSVSLLGEVEGAAYMYNDFTGATLFDRPIYLLYDFEKRGVSNTKWAKYHWVPRIGYSANPQGILAWYRCYKKGQQPPGDNGFKSFSLGTGVVQHDLPGCGGEGMTQVEFKFERDSNTTVRFTRFQNFSVTIGK